MVQVYGHLAGPLAIKYLKASTFGVVARFNRSFYLQGCMAGVPELLCIGKSDLEPGPINVLCRQWPSEKNLPSPGRAINRSGKVISWDQGYIDLAEMKVWVPPVCPVIDQGTLLEGLQSLRSLVNKSTNRDGLIPLLLSHPDKGIYETYQKMLIKIAWNAVQDLRAWLRNMRGANTHLINGFPGHAVKSLIGLGPGLTPSGDDLLGGMLIALNSTGQTEISEILWSSIVGIVSGTNEISQAHLKAAAHGMGAEVLHQLLVSLISGKSLDNLIERLSNVGHSSGWDAVVGACLVLDACCE